MKRLITWATTLSILLSAGLGEAVSAAVRAAADTSLAAAVAKSEIISPAIGTVTHAQVGDSDQTVILIQDLHCAAEVQRNISSILAALDNQYHLKNVYIEGGYGALSTAWLRDIRDEKAKTELRENLLDNGRLTGSENYAVVANRPDLLVGVDEEHIHKQNVVRLAEIIDKRQYFAGKLEQLNRDRAVLNRVYLHSRNARFNAVLSAYRSGKIPPRKFYRLLRKYVDIVNKKARPDLFSINLAAFPQMQRFSEEAEMLHRLDQAQFAKDLRGYLSFLKQQLPYSAFQQLASKTDNFNDMPQLLASLGNILDNDNLRRACRQSFPELYAYLMARCSGQPCNPVALIAEERRLIEQIRFGLSEDISDLDLAFIDEFFGYLNNYLHAALSTDDLEYVQRNFARFRELWRTYSYDTGLEELCRDSDLLKTFYAVNQQRNEIFLRSIASREPLTNGTHLAAVPETAHARIAERLRQSRVIVLVAGGFHTRGLTDLLAARNISSITITPTVTADPGTAGAVYAERACAQAKLFANQTIALTVESQGVPVVSITDTTIVLDVNGERVSFTRGENAAQPFWHWQGGNGISEQGAAAAKAFEAALNAMIGFLHDVQSLGNPAQQHESLYRILKFLARQASATGIFRGNGLIPRIANDPYLISIIPRVESLTLDEFSQLAAWMQHIIATHALMQFASRQPDAASTTPVDTEYLLSILETLIPHIIARKQQHVREVNLCMKWFVTGDWDALYNKFKPEQNVDRQEYGALLEKLLLIYQNLPLDQQNILKVATIFHDVGALDGARDWLHYEPGANMVRDILPPFGYRKDFVENVAKMVYYHSIYPNFSINFVMKDLDGLSEQEKDILLLLSVFDLSGKPNGNPCIPAMLRWLLELRYNASATFNGDGFYEYRMSTLLFPVLTTHGDRLRNFEKYRQTILADTQFQQTYGRYWNTMVRTYVPSLFHMIGERSYDNFARMIVQISEAIAKHEAPGVNEVIIDSDIDLMSLGGSDAAVEIITSLHQMLADHGTLPLQITQQGLTLHITVLLQPLASAILPENKPLVEQWIREGKSAVNIAVRIGVGKEFLASFLHPVRFIFGHPDGHERRGAKLVVGIGLSVALCAGVLALASWGFHGPLWPLLYHLVESYAAGALANMGTHVALDWRYLRAIKKQQNMPIQMNANTEREYAFYLNADRSKPGRLTVNGKEARFIGMGRMTQVFEHTENPAWVVRINVSGRVADMETEYEKFTMLAALGLSSRVIQRIMINNRYEGVIVEQVRPVADRERQSSDSGTLLASLLESLIKNKLLMLDFNPNNIMLGTIGSSAPAAYVVDVLDVLRVPYLSGSLIRDLYCCIYNQEAEDWKKSSFNTVNIEQSQEYRTKGKYFILKMIGPVILYKVFCKMLDVNTTRRSLLSKISNQRLVDQNYSAVTDITAYKFYPARHSKTPARLVVDGDEAKYISRGSNTVVFEHPKHPDLVIRVDVSGGMINVNKEFRRFNTLAKSGIAPRAISVLRINDGYNALVVEKVISSNQNAELSNKNDAKKAMVQLIDHLLHHRLLLIDFAPSNIIIGSIKGGPIQAYVCDITLVWRTPLPQSLLSVMYLYFYTWRSNLWKQKESQYVAEHIKRHVGFRWYATKIAVGTLLLPFLAFMVKTEYIVGQIKIQSIMRSLEYDVTFVVNIVTAVARRLSSSVLAYGMNIVLPQIMHATYFSGFKSAHSGRGQYSDRLSARASDVAATVFNSDTRPVLIWHYGNSAPVHGYASVSVSSRYEVYAHLFVRESLPENPHEWNLQPTNILVNGKTVFASARGGMLRLFCDGEKPEKIIEVVSRMLVGTSGMPGDTALGERFSELVYQATGVRVETRFRQGILIDHARSGKTMGYTPWGAMVVSADFLDLDNQVTAGSDTVELLASLQTVQRTESFVAAQNIYYYLDQSDDVAKFLTAPASFCVAKNAQVIISAALLADYTPEKLWDMNKRARKAGITVYVDLGTDDMKKTAWRDRGFSGYLQGDDVRVGIHDYILQGTVIHAAHIRGYQNAGELREKLAAARENGKILRYSEVKVVFAHLSLTERLDMLAGMVTGMLTDSISETQVRAMAHAWERTALPPLPDDIAALLRVVASGTAAEIEATLHIKNTHAAVLYLEKILQQAGTAAEAEKLQKEFLIILIERQLAKDALADPKIAKPLGLADQRLEILLGEKLLWLALQAAAAPQPAPSAEVQAFMLQHQGADAAEFYRLLLSHVEELAASDSQSSVVDLITLILKCAEPRLLDDMQDSDTLFNIDATGDFLSAA